MEKEDVWTANHKIHLQQVLIKWTGDKRRQDSRMVGDFPHYSFTYHKPFLDGGSVLVELLGSDMRVDDDNPPARSRA